MRYYPVSLDINDKDCLVIGGGTVGTRKVKMLLQCGAKVTVVSTDFSETLSDLEGNDRLHLARREYRPEDCDASFLVICATDNPDLNLRVSEDAKSRGILCNIADRPDASGFVLPSVISRGDLTLTISTSGKSPAFSKKLRKDLEDQFGDEYADFLMIMGIIRQKLLSEGHNPDQHRQQFRALIDQGLLDRIRTQDITGADKILNRVLGSEYSYNDLMNEAINR